MKYLSPFLIAMVLLLCFVACEKEKSAAAKRFSEQTTIIGNWVYAGNDSIYHVYEKANSLDSNKFGYSFLEGGAFIERENAGWCMTPPSYANFAGSWSIEREGLISIHVAYWGGKMEYTIKIISLDSSLLKVDYIYSKVDTLALN
jgi:hypothetical protein